MAEFTYLVCPWMSSDSPYWPRRTNFRFFTQSGPEPDCRIETGNPAIAGLFISGFGQEQTVSKHKQSGLPRFLLFLHSQIVFALIDCACFQFTITGTKSLYA